MSRRVFFFCGRLPHFPYVGNSSGKRTEQVPCVPISAVLEALNYKSLDLVSLDTEGNEPQILVTFPFHLVDIDVFMVECGFCDRPTGRDYKRKRDFLKTFFDAHGYDEKYYDRVDFIYQKRRKLGRM